MVTNINISKDNFKEINQCHNVIDDNHDEMQ